MIKNQIWVSFLIALSLMLLFDDYDVAPTELQKSWIFFTIVIPLLRSWIIRQNTAQNNVVKGDALCSFIAPQERYFQKKTGLA
jgi:hypothetical protein